VATPLRHVLSPDTAGLLRCVHDPLAPLCYNGSVLTKERQDYLKVIYHLQQGGAPVRTTAIARALGVEPASVTGAIKRLAEINLLEYQRYRGVTLTADGERTALEIIRNHRLIELYLIEALGYSWDEVHEEAERLEHAVSPRFIERIAATLDHPEIDPHGSPIPTTDGRIEPETGRRLSELASGEAGVVVRVNDEDPELLRYLGGLGLRPGATVRVDAVAPFGGPITVKVGVETHALGPLAAAHVFVDARPR
jgi:DtxR family Mn-dependent transcriptional regulator